MSLYQTAAASASLGLPAELGRLSNLERLCLSGNRLTGCVPEGLRDVADNDFAVLGLPFCPAPQSALAGLSVGPRALRAEFDPSHTEYTTTTGLSSVTVTAAIDGDADVRFLDENGNEMGDADAALQGHQIELGPGVTIVEVEVTSQDGAAANTYTVKVTYEDLAGRYDVDDDGTINRDEAVTAVVDHFDGAISRDEALAVIILYFAG